MTTPYRPRISEDRHQQTLMEWARTVRRRYMLDSEADVSVLDLLYSIPNGGHRNKATAGKLKATGVRAGVPDLHLPVPRGTYVGLWIEMKARDGRVSRAQGLWLRMLAQLGHATTVCYGWEEAQRALVAYLALPPPPRQEAL